MRKRDEWTVFSQERVLSSEAPPWIYDWEGDGVISRITTPRLARALRGKGIKLINLSDRYESHSLEFPLVRSDDEAIGRTAAEHLLERGYRKFAYCGFSQEGWSDRRGQAFVNHLRASGRPHCEFFSSPLIFGTESFEDQRNQIADWVRNLPKPLGLMACNDIRGQQVTAACAQANLAIPEDVAVIGVDNDTLVCQLCSTPLSSVIPNAELIGYLAAEKLSNLMNGQSEQPLPTTVPPLGIVARRSTDMIAVADKDVSTALRFIRENACNGITVSDVASRISISRSTLERRMRESIDRTPQQQIRHVQISRVRELLAESDESLSQIANLCGFEHPEYMHVVFKREVGVTPGEFRRSTKPHNSRLIATQGVPPADNK